MLLKLSMSRSSFSRAISNSLSTNSTSCIAKSELTKPSAKMSSSPCRSMFWMWRARKALTFVLMSCMLCSSIGLLITVKTLAAFATKQTCVYHLLEKRAGPVFAVVIAFVQHVDRVEDGVQADQIGGLQRPHLVAEARFEDLVYILRARYLILYEENSFIHRQHEDAVRYEARHVVDEDALLAHARQQTSGNRNRLLGCVIAANHFD